MRRWAAALLCLASGFAGGQGLAHKGWAGNGIAVTPWWQGAVFYALGEGWASQAGGQLDEQPGELLDELRELGVDAVMAPAATGDELLDRLVREATARRLRVLAELPADGSESEVESHARALLNRGVAGLRLLPGDNLNAGEQARRQAELARMVASFPGQRLLLWDGPAMAEPRAAGSIRSAGGTRNAVRSRTAQASIDHAMRAWPELDAAGLRRLLAGERAGAAPARVIDGEDLRPALLRAGAEGPTARRVAAAMLLGDGAPLLYAGEEGSGALAAWSRRLGDIRHNSAAVREGRLELLDVGASEVVAWVWRARAGGVVSPPVLVVVNFSDRPLRLGLGAALARAGVAPGSGELRTLAATAENGEVMRVSSLGVQPGGVYVGEVKGPAGLEAAAPVLRKRRR